MDRKHYIKNALIKDLFLEDKKELFKLPEDPFEVYKYEFAKADNYGKIKFDTKIYSSSPNMAKKQVMIKVGAYDVEILDEDSNLTAIIDRLVHHSHLLVHSGPSYRLTNSIMKTQ